MSDILVIGTLPQSLINFRGDLLSVLVASGHRVIAMADDSDPGIEEKLADIGVAFRSYPVQRNGMNPIEDLRTLLALRKIFQELNPDIILAYTIKPVIWGGLALYGYRRVRFYPMITGLGFAFQVGGGRRRILSVLVTSLYKRSIAKASCVIFQNRDNRDLFVDLGVVARSKCAVVDGSGVNVSYFETAPLPDDAVVFLSIGRLLGEKGFRIYAQAARIVKQKFPNVIFRLVGPTDPSPDGIKYEEVQEWVKSGCIEYLGESRDVRPHLRRSSIFVLPSYYLEGIPRTLLEALSIGRPILTTDSSGCRETVIPGENGWLVPKKNANALAERMIWFVENRDQWQRMGERSRQIAEERFDVHKINSDLMKIMKLQNMDFVDAQEVV